LLGHEKPLTKFYKKIFFDNFLGIAQKIKKLTSYVENSPNGDLPQRQKKFQKMAILIANLC
jgi:hypothetical protein